MINTVYQPVNSIYQLISTFYQTLLCNKVTSKVFLGDKNGLSIENHCLQDEKQKLRIKVKSSDKHCFEIFCNIVLNKLID